LPCAQRRAHFAALRAVHTEVHALGMFLFPLAHERCAVMEARIASHLAIGADACALQHHGGVWIVGRERRRAHDEESQSHRTLRDHSVIHNHRLSLQKLANRLRRQHASVHHGPFRANDSFGSRCVLRDRDITIQTPCVRHALETIRREISLLTECCGSIGCGVAPACAIRTTISQGSELATNGMNLQSLALFLR
jgi:hypothetical protein